ncbi:MAG: hypothetical protein JNM56_28485, partial [Planctomycetia bacterium]|nr:hypothetical protein [Planctomycetia bacterium]
PWPHPPDYNEAIQNPQHCFKDPDLRQGQPAVNALGLPWPRSGNSADVYKLVGPDGKTWAVKCFTREVSGLHARYQAVSDYLQHGKQPFMVRFQYLDEGIRIQGQWYPVVKMRWVEGFNLNDLIKDYLDKPLILERLAGIWLRLAEEMRAARIVHGDLQHGNVLLVPREEGGKMRLRLIDYDGLVVPSLATLPSGELGHPNYQHPDRLRDGIAGPEVDRFAHLVIYTALRSLARGGKPLWDRYDNGDNLLFRERDFAEPGKSALFTELTAMNDPVVSPLAGHLLLACQEPLDQAPLLQGLLAEGGSLLPLTSEQRERVAAVLAGGGSAVPNGGFTLVDARETDDEIDNEELPSWKEIAVGLAERAGEWLQQTGGQLRRLGTTPVEELIGWNARRRQAMWGAVGGLAALVTLTVVALFLSRSWGSASADPERPPSVTHALPRLAGSDRTTVQIGDNVLKVAVDRRGQEGPLRLEFTGLPDGMSCDAIGLNDNQEAALLDLHVRASTPPGEYVGALQLFAGQRLVDRLPYQLTVEEPTLAGLTYGPDEVLCLAGEKQTVRVTIERRRYLGPVELVVADLPAGMRCEPAVIPAEQQMAELVFTAAPDAQSVAEKVRLAARVGTREVWSWKMSVAVARPMGLRILPVPAVTLRAGESQPVKVNVERQGYTGELTVKLAGLPPGVTAKPVTLTEREALAEFLLEADAFANTVELAIAAELYIGKTRIEDQPFALTVQGPTRKQWPTENVRFASADGVQLWATWRRSEKGKDAPCVLLLPNIGGHRRQEGWEKLAQKLQAKGYAVLSLDYRGHGDSTTVNAGFWQEPGNKGQIRGSNPNPFDLAPRDTIRMEDFLPTYYPALANDLAAARLYLDYLNDDGKCNASNLIVIGAQEGATLGAMWLYAESNRYSTPAPLKPLARPSTSPESTGIAAAVWLNISPTLGERGVPLAEWLRLTSRDRKIPMTFVHGGDDAAGAEQAKRWVQEIQADPFGLKLATMTTVEKTRAAGQGLLDRDPNADEQIVAYCEKAFELAPIPWMLRAPESKAYVWSFPASTAIIAAKRKGDKPLRLLPLPQLGLR